MAEYLPASKKIATNRRAKAMEAIAECRRALTDPTWTPSPSAELFDPDEAVGRPA
jgi:hypothetical protein